MGGTSSAQAVSGQEVPTLDDLIKTLPKMMRVSSDIGSVRNYRVYPKIIIIAEIE